MYRSVLLGGTNVCLRLEALSIYCYESEDYYRLGGSGSTVVLEPDALPVTNEQGRVFEADEYYKTLERLGNPASYAEALVDVFW